MTTTTCQEFAELARKYVQLGGKLHEIIDGPFVAYEINVVPTGGAGDGVSTGKFSDDFLKRLAALRIRTVELEQQKL